LRCAGIDSYDWFFSQNGLEAFKVRVQSVLFLASDSSRQAAATAVGPTALLQPMPVP
jgi:hypothetical protein